MPFPLLAPAWYQDAVTESTGASIAAAGDLDGDAIGDLAVGATDAATGRSGRVEIASGTAWGPEMIASTELVGTGVSDWFGSAVAGVGDVNADGMDDLLVGSAYYTGAYAYEGRVEVFWGAPGGPAATSGWAVDGGQERAELGATAAAAGDVDGDGIADLLAGAPSYDGGHTDEGAVWLFYGAAGGPSLTPDWAGEADSTGAELGTTLAGGLDLDGDGYADLAAGAPGYDGAEVNSGRVYAWLGGATGPGAAWTLDGADGDALGAVLDLAPDVDGDGDDELLLGMPDRGYGEVWVFLGGAGGLGAAPDVTITGGSSSPTRGLGSRVCGAGDVDGDGYGDVLTDADYDVLVYSGGPGGIVSTTYTSSRSSVVLGTLWARLGDMDGDGYADLGLGAPDAGSGEAWVVYGSASGLDLLAGAGWAYEGTDGDYAIGEDVVGAGDVDGDGYADLAVAYAEDGGSSGQGLTLVRGGPDGLAASPDTPVEPGWDYDPIRATALGDVNDDTLADVLVSSSASGSGGAATLYYGTVAGLSVSASLTLEGDQGSEFFGAAATAGDFHGDGLVDLVIGAPRYDNPDSAEGLVRVYAGRSGGPSSTPTWTWEPDLASAQAGDALAAGDFDGDGYDDLLVGAAGYTATVTSEGAVLLFPGGAGGLPSAPTWMATSGQASAHCDRVAAVGDVNGDGLADFAVGCPEWDGAAGADSGRVQVWLGSPRGPAATADWEFEGETSGIGLGDHLASAGDVDGDGYADLVVAATAHDVYVAGQGLVYVFRGGPAGPSASPDLTLTWYPDALGFGAAITLLDPDGDGVSALVAGAADLDTLVAWTFPDGDGDGTFTVVDCDDADPSRSHTIPEACNGIDDNCDGLVDNNAGDATFTDADGDGYGDPATEAHSCDPPDDAVTTAGDCDDTAAAISPEAEERCDGIDNNCDGDVDEGAPPTWYADADGDGAGDPERTTSACDPPEGYVATPDDCDDLEPAVHPGADERCNEVDDDCDGTADEDAVDGTAWYMDADGDGWGAGGAAIECTAPKGWVAEDGDCDDAHADAFPGGTEVWYDGIDQDCDGNDTDQDGDGVPWPTDCDDLDPTVTTCTEPPDTATTPKDEADAACGGCTSGGGESGVAGMAAVIALALTRRRARPEVRAARTASSAG